MIDIKVYKTEHGVEPFSDFLNSLRDARAKVQLTKAVKKMGKGLFGNAKSLGDGLQEYKINEGAGYRIYYYNDGQTLVILLSASNKKDQNREIKNAKNYLSDYKRQMNEKGTENEIRK